MTNQIPKSLTDSQISTSSDKSKSSKPNIFSSTASFFRSGSFRRKISSSLSTVVQLARDQLEPLVNYNVERSVSTNQNLNPKIYVGTDITSHHNETYAHACMRGRRPTQEDAFAYHSFDTYQCYGIFDGHGSSEVSQACAKHLFKLLEKNINEAKETQTKFDPW